MKHGTPVARTAIPVALSLSAVLSTGPQIQEQLFAVLDGNAPSIYGSAYQDNIALFPSLEVWILQAFNPLFLIVAIIVAMIATAGSSPRRLFYVTALWTFSLLTISDSVFGAFLGELTIAYVVSNATSNVVGSLICATFATLTVKTSDLKFRNAPSTIVSRWFISIIFCASAGLFLSAAIYYADRTMFEPIPVRVEAYLAPPISGFYAPAERSDAEGARSSDDQQFHLVWRELGGARVSLRSAGHDPMSLGWKSLRAEDNFGVSISIFNGCGLSQEEALPQASPAKFDDVRNVAFSFDSGLVQLATTPTSSSDVSLNFAGDGPTMYWVDRGTEEGTLRLTEFLPENSEWSYSDTSDTTQLSIVIPSIITVGETVADGDRVMHIQVGDNSFPIVVRASADGTTPETDVYGNEAIQACTSVDTAKTLQEGELALSGPNSLLVVFRVNRSASDKIHGVRHSEIVAANSNGWITADNVEEDVVGIHDAGTLDLISFSGNIQDLKVDDQKRDTLPVEHYVASGKLRAAIEADQHIRVTGTADTLWRDNNRLNQTRWEIMTWEYRGAVLAIFGIVPFLLAALVKLLKEDEPLQWLDRG